MTTEEENEKALEKIQKDVDEETKKPTKEELPDERPIRFFAFMLAREPLAVIAWCMLGIISFSLLMTPATVVITPDLTVRAGDIGAILLLVYGGVSAFFYWIWIRKVRYVKRLKAKSEQASPSAA